MIPYHQFKALMDIWKMKNYDALFYFEEIFPLALNQLVENTYSSSIDVSKYRALYVPVGYSIENIALISAIMHPQYLMLAMTDSTRQFHRKHINLLEDNLNKRNSIVKITSTTIASDDQINVEKNIVEWIEEMRNICDVPYREMAIDLTGGTKPMSIGAHNAAMSFDEIDAFYLRTDYDADTKLPVPGTERILKVKKTRSQVDEQMVFVAMPFKDEFKDIYEKGIQPAIGEIGKKCIRVDEQVFTGPIMEKINDNILKAKVIVTELTEYNPNVFYELGLAHGYNKKVIMLTQDISKIPFDLRHLRIVKYDKGDLDAFKEQMKVEILSVCSE